MSCLVLSLLGPFQALLDDQPLTGFRSDKSRALLAYLAAEAPRPHPRGVLAGLLWPNHPDDVALTYLRGALANLRRLLGDEQGAHVPFLLAERAAIQLNPAAPLQVDTVALDALDALDGPLPPGGAHLPTTAALERAALFYRGPFLEGFALDDSPPFEEWLLLKREHYQQRALAALRRLGAAALAQGDYAAAARFAHRQLALESWDETAHCQLMLALALSGQRSAALAQYAACRTLLAQELGAEPSPETTDLYLRIRANHLCAPPAPAGIGGGSGSPLGAPPHLPHAAVPLVARSGELARLDAALDCALAGEGRTVFVRGDAGSGKTALIYTFGRAAALRYPHLLAADGRSGGEIMRRLQAGEVGTAWARQAADREPWQSADWLQAAARRRPLLLLLDDLQWADGGTLAWLFELGHRLEGARILIVAAYRPEDVAQHSGGPRHPLHTLVHELQRAGGEAPVDLDCADGRALVDALLDAEPNRLGADFRAALYRRTEGHALFTLELLRAMQASGALVRNAGGEWVPGPGLTPAALPPRIEAVIAERIERLPSPLRTLLETASVQGERFGVEVLARSLPPGCGLDRLPAAHLAWLLDEQLGREYGLVQADLPAPDGPPRPYRFTHALYQTYLYQSLDPARRADVQRRVSG